MTCKEFFGLAHNYDDSVIEEARRLLEDYLEQQNYTDIAVYIAEAHGGYVFLCARYKDGKKSIDTEFHVTVVDGKCEKLYSGFALSTWRRNDYGNQTTCVR